MPPRRRSAFPAGKAGGEGRTDPPRRAWAGGGLRGGFWGALGRGEELSLGSPDLVCFCCCRGWLVALPRLCELLLHIIANVKAIFFNSGSLNSFNLNCI